MTRAVALLAVAAALALAACSSPTEPRREYAPDMVDPVPFESYSAHPTLPGRRTMQRPPAGALAVDEVPFAYGRGPAEAERAGRELLRPQPATPETIARGEKVFRAICSPCHGPTGQGDGPIIPRFPMPPSLTAPHARGLPDGQIVHVLMRGQGLMPAHAPQVAPADRWKVVDFIRSLQAAAAAPPAAPPKEGT